MCTEIFKVSNTMNCDVEQDDRSRSRVKKKGFEKNEHVQSAEWMKYSSPQLPGHQILVKVDFAAFHNQLCHSNGQKGVLSSGKFKIMSVTSLFFLPF